MHPEEIEVAPPAVSLRNAVVWTFLSLIAFGAIEAAIFRSGWYLRFLEPNSTTGQLELHYSWLNRSPPLARAEVMVLGDSRMAEGFSAKRADEAVQNRIHFLNEGVGGTSPRVWYYFVRDVDPSRKRFAAIVIPVDHYWDRLSARFVDLNYAIGRLRLGDCFDFTRSLDAPGQKFEAFTGCVFKGVTLRQDFKAFAGSPSERLKAAGEWRANGAGYVEDYEGRTENVIGIQPDWVDGTVQFPNGLTEMQRSTIRQSLIAVPQRESDELTEYRQRWMGRILSLYENSPTRIIFIQMPQAPFRRPEREEPTAFVTAQRSNSHVRVIPNDTFPDLDRPELFADGLHLNREGRVLFSERLAAKVAEVVGGR